MAQAVVPAMQCQMGALGKSAVRARPAAAGGRVWGVRRAARGTAGFKVLALGPETTGVVQRMNQLLDMDTTPFTDKIIAEYIWYVRPPNVAFLGCAGAGFVHSLPLTPPTDRTSSFR
jgi:glutamine synthetase